MSSSRWTEVATERLKARFADEGLVRVHSVTGWPQQISVWLGTETDAQSDKLAALPALHELVSEILEQVAKGESESTSALRAVGVQSEETVERDYEGSWFYALR